jgi:hypothetical protein
LDRLARQGSSPRRQLKPGTVLVRDYQGQRHSVTVTPDGFDWQGTTYTSLSAIARAITGTAWSGPRFFALARGNGTPARQQQEKYAREPQWVVSRARIKHRSSRAPANNVSNLKP